MRSLKEIQLKIAIKIKKKSLKIHKTPIKLFIYFSASQLPSSIFLHENSHKNLPVGMNTLTEIRSTYFTEVV